MIKNLASSIEDSVAMCDEIVNNADSLSPNVPTNFKSIVLTNFHSNKVRYKMGGCILRTALLVVILLFLLLFLFPLLLLLLLFAIIMRNIVQNRKTYCHASNIKIENNKF